MSVTRMAAAVAAHSGKLSLAVCALVALCAAMPVLAQGPSVDAGAWTAPERAAQRTNPVLATDDAIRLGKFVFTVNCESCHGKNGHGDGQQAGSLSKHPADLLSEKVQSQSDGALFWKIAEGRGDMPTTQFKLKDQERWAVVDYLRSLASKTSKH